MFLTCVLTKIGSREQLFCAARKSKVAAFLKHGFFVWLLLSEQKLHGVRHGSMVLMA
jgi:hypothetical protein